MINKELTNESLYQEAIKMLKTPIENFPLYNHVVALGFDETAFDHLIMIAVNYGTPVIYCNYEFSIKLLPHKPEDYTEKIKKEIWETNRLSHYKGIKLIIEDDLSNTQRIINSNCAWIIPTNTDGKPTAISTHVYCYTDLSL